MKWFNFCLFEFVTSYISIHKSGLNIELEFTVCFITYYTWRQGTLTVRIHICFITWLTSFELQELLVAFSPSEQNIHPDSHGFGRGSHQIIFPLLSLHAECDPLSGGLTGLMINIDLSDRMKINATFYFGLKNKVLATFVSIFNEQTSDLSE